MTTFSLCESDQFLAESYSQTDRRCAQRIIRAGTSLRGTVYSPEVLQSALTLFEGAQTFADHPTADEDRLRPERSVRGITGWLTDVHWREDALWATRHFTRNQAGADMLSLIEDILSGKAPPSLMGASINIIGKGKRANGKVIIESIDRVVSVDDVTMPAAGGGFQRESASAEDLASLLTYEEWFGQSAFVERARKEWQTLRKDERITEATALADTLTSDLTAAKQRIEALERSLLAERESHSRLRARLDISEALRPINLPDEWKTEISARLENLPREDWVTFIQSEINKARTLIRASRGVVPARLDVREDAPPAVSLPLSRHEQMRRAQTPEQLREIERQTS